MSVDEREVRNSPKQKDKREKEKVVVEVVNRKRVVVDLTALVTTEEEDNGGGLYVEELGRRAEGKEKEEELLKMLSEMKGEWCSRRKKRRSVEACFLGDALPVRWKLIIALHRKSGRFFPYCHCYISWTGEHLASCKEVTSYLRSYFGICDTSRVLADVLNSAVPDSCVAIESSTKGLDPSVKVIAVSVTNRNELGSTSNEFGIKNDSEKTSAVFAELSLLNNIGDILMADVETSKEVRTYSRRVSVNNTDIGPMIFSTAKRAIDGINLSSNYAFSAKNERSATQHKLDPEQTKVYEASKGNELVLPI